MPWPGPQDKFVILILEELLTMEIQSSPADGSLSLLKHFIENFMRMSSQNRINVSNFCGHQHRKLLCKQPSIREKDFLRKKLPV